MSLRAVSAALAVAACGGPTLEPAEIDRDCAPLYEPTFANVFDQTLVGKCAVEGACHRGPDARRGLRLDEIDVAHGLRLQQDRVIPGDPEHSEVTMRIYTEHDELLMPPGERLSDAEACAVALWIAEGAEP